ncbi:MAG: DRTGG domain-containing protein [Chloroflexota bacterium]
MRPLLVCSLEAAAGKTAICIGVARRLWKDGLRVGYLKPVAPGEPADGDVGVIKSVLELPQPVTALAAEVPQGAKPGEVAKQLRSALAEVAKDSDLVLVEGGSTLATGARAGMSAPELADVLGARVLLVVRYKVDLLDGVLMAARDMGDKLAGVVVNAVPPSQLAKVRDSLRPALEEAGVRVLGVVPQDRVLLGVTVRDLAQKLGGSIACCPDFADEIVERLMIGAMSVDGALVYFRKHANKAVITGGDRPDIQLAALATPTRCLILTGGFPIDPMVRARAQETRVPIIVTDLDTLNAVDATHEVFKTSRFHQKAKVGRLESLIADSTDFAALRAKVEA